MKETKDSKLSDHVLQRCSEAALPRKAWQKAKSGNVDDRPSRYQVATPPTIA